MTKITRIINNVYRISTYIPEGNFQCCQFLITDEQPLLYHTGLRSHYPQIYEAIYTVIHPEKLKWFGFIHFEADECGSIQHWQTVAPNATFFCSTIGKQVSVDDISLHPVKGMNDNETFSTGKFHFRYILTPHVPHGWDSGMLFEETRRILFCSDLFHQQGDVEAITKEDIADRFKTVINTCQKMQFNEYLALTNNTDKILERLASLKPKIIAPMHGSVFIGNGEQVINKLREIVLELMAVRV
jgi:flavorubredoxin